MRGPLNPGRMLLLAAAWLVMPGADPDARAADAVTEAESLIREGLALRRKGYDERALPLFQKAYASARTPRTAGQLGFSEMSVGYFAESEQHMNEALSSPDHPWVAKNLEIIRGAVLTVRKSIGELIVGGSPADAQIWINGRQVGQLPNPAPLRLNKGAIDVELRASGYASGSRSLTIRGGEKQSVTINLEKVPPPVAEARPRPAPVAPPPPPPVSPPPAVPAAPGPSTTHIDTPTVNLVVTGHPESESGGGAGRTLGWATTAVAGIALAAGVVETIVWLNKKSEFDNHVGTLPPPADQSKIVRNCGSDNANYGGAGCQEIHDDLLRARTWALVGYGVGGALAITSAVLFATSGTDHPKTAHAFSCAPDLLNAGLTCGLPF